MQLKRVMILSPSHAKSENGNRAREQAKTPQDSPNSRLLGLRTLQRRHVIIAHKDPQENSALLLADCICGSGAQDGRAVQEHLDKEISAATPVEGAGCDGTYESFTDPGACGSVNLALTQQYDSAWCFLRRTKALLFGPHHNDPCGVTHLRCRSVRVFTLALVPRVFAAS